MSELTRGTGRAELIDAGGSVVNADLLDRLNSASAWVRGKSAAYFEAHLDQIMAIENTGIMVGMVVVNQVEEGVQELRDPLPKTLGEIPIRASLDCPLNEVKLMWHSGGKHADGTRPEPIQIGGLINLGPPVYA